MALRIVDFGTALRECKEDRIMAVIDCANHKTISLDDLYFLLMDDPEPAADPEPDPAPEEKAEEPKKGLSKEEFVDAMRKKRGDL